MLITAQVQSVLSRRLLDVFIQAGLIAALAAFCYQIFGPFMTLMLWAVILAVTLFPLHQMVVRKTGCSQGRAATLIIILGIVLIFVPMVLLSSSLADAITNSIDLIKNNTLTIPLPPDSVESWPIIGKKVHGLWYAAATDLPGLIQSYQPKMGDLARKALGFVAGIGGGLLKFFASFIIAGVIMAFGHEGHQSARAIGRRFGGAEKGEAFVVLSTATIRAVAQGVIGIAFIQATLLGVILLVAQIPFAGVLAIIALILGIAQLPALLVSLPAIAYIWMSGAYSTLLAIFYSVLLLLAGAVDNVLKPLMLGRGVDAPMPVVLMGALGGMVSGGILGMFVGAVMLALGYQIFMDWVAMQTETEVDAVLAVTTETDPVGQD
ncbi:AI-2E family transporter [Silvimonas iriomotensis]|uniref:AI-2E family transporter n=1 Tax=Silvimonas iriomotensis TaxID=449662 RepID=A0ABQ2PB64_9NEIS|nr:AI-2E family transporter [Silvimonas iriomotensis]GGP22315.1 AI-2E family transporter [Silvimonas iriomotensis]